jgi:hypothetical protein
LQVFPENSIFLKKVHKVKSISPGCEKVALEKMCDKNVE